VIKSRRCIFCRKKPVMFEIMIGQVKIFQLQCPDCGCYGEPDSERDSAILNWNKRSRGIQNKLDLERIRQTGRL